MKLRSVRVRLVIVGATVLLAGLVPAGPRSIVAADESEGAIPVAADAQRRVTGGGLHTCAVLDTGRIRCWGQNEQGQLGNGTTSVETVPQEVASISTALSVSAGSTHTCALLHGGTVACWGNNGNGQAGNGTTSPPDAPVLTPAEVAGIDDATAIAAGGFHACALRAAGTVACWGNDGSGQLGDGSGGDASVLPVPVVHDADGDPTTEPVPLDGVTAVAAGEYHTCALLGASGEVACWGHNSFGQLGDGTTVDRDTAVRVAGIPDDDPHAHDPHKALAITAGEGHTCAVLDDNSARCWGHNFYGQLGNDTTYTLPDQQGGTDSTTPVTVVTDVDPDPLVVDAQPLDGLVSITAGQFHTCAATAGGGAYCWGNNGRGQLGDDGLFDHPRNQPRATPVGGLGGVRAVTAGGFHTCALVAGNTMRCWGYNFYGQLGHYRASSRVPVTVTALSGATTVTTGDGHVCTLRTRAAPLLDEPFCWGNNANGELGAGLVPAPASSTIPVAVSGVADAGGAGPDPETVRPNLMSAGNEHACLLPAGGVVCWGRNSDGELGDGTNTSSNVPVTVTGMPAATQVSAGGGLRGGPELGHTCGRTPDGAAWCWGANGAGQLGDRTITSASSPVRVWSDHDDDHLNTPPPALTPPVELSGVASVAAGGAHSCAVETSGQVRCWGANEDGQLGDGTKLAARFAVTVDTDPDEPDPDETTHPAGKHFEPLTAVVAVSTGAGHTCALRSDGTVWCWGRNSSGQLGDGTFIESTVPVQVTGLAGTPLAVSAGDDHTCARIRALSGSTGVMCWGANSAGQLGNGGAAASPTPVFAHELDPPGGDAAGTDLVRSVSAGRSNTCAVLLDTTVSCWGDNAFGQLGDGVGQESWDPLQVLSLGSVGGNSIPGAVDDAATVTAPPPVAPHAIAVLANDTDADGDTLTVSAVGPAGRGSAMTDGSTVTYTPAEDFCTADPTSNVDTFTYSVTDGTATTNATVTINVGCPNTAPDAEDDVATTAEESAVTIDVVANDTDINGDTVTVDPGSVSAPAHGSAVLDAEGTITYTPDPDFAGNDAFGYRAADGAAASAIATVSITVTNVNDAPVATDDGASTPEDRAVVIAVTANDTDVDGPSIAVAAVSDPPNGAAAASSPTEVTYTPAADFCGSDGFTYTVSDGSATDTAAVSVSVSCTNDGPNAVNDAATTGEDSSVVIAVLANDTDAEGDTLTVTGAGPASHGTATVGAGTTVTYTPSPDFCGADSFSYTISDGSGTDSALVVPVVVLCVNDAPVAVDDGATTPEDTPIAVDAAANDIDVDGDELRASGLAAPAPANGTVTLTATGLLYYEPVADFCGTDVFGYRVADPDGAHHDGIVSISIACVNDAPLLGAIADQSGPWGETASIPLAVTDPDSGDTAAFTLVAAPAGASIGEVAPGTFAVVWAPTSAQVGTRAFSVRVTDASGASDDEDFLFRVARRATSLTYTGPLAGQHTDPAQLRASLLDYEGSPVAGGAIGFALGSRSAGATTDAAGTAEASVVLTDRAGSSYAVTATFGGNAAYGPSTASSPFTIDPERVLTTYAGGHLQLAAGSSSPVNLVATVAEEADGSIGSGIATLEVTFSEVGGGVLCVAPVAMAVPGAGTASCTTTALPPGSRAVVAIGSGDSYTGTADVGAFAVAQEVPGGAAGAGRTVGGGAIDDFAFQARPVRKSPPQGDALHIYRTGSIATVVESATLTSLTRSCTGGKAKACSLTVDTSSPMRWSVDLTSGTVAPLAAGSTVSIAATDGADPGTDTYSVAIGTPDEYSLATPTAQQPVTGGAIRAF